jgi:hypothetical protein
MQELQQAVTNAFAAVVASGSIEAAIQKNLKETIDNSIREQLRSYSDFGKAIDEHVKAALRVDFSQLGLPGYNDLILKIVRRQVEAQVNATLAAQIEPQLTELLRPAPIEITLRDFVAEFIKNRADYNAGFRANPHEITLHVEGSDVTDGYHNIYMDEDPGCSKYSCRIQIATTKDHRVYSLKINEHDPKKALFVGPLFDFERRLFQMYASGTKLIVDDEHEDISRCYPDYAD